MNTTTQSPFRRFVAYSCVVALFFGAFTLGAVAVGQRPAGATGPGTAVLASGQQLSEGQALVSGNGYTALLQTDGNFVVYSPTGTPLWADGVNNGFGTNFIVLQSDGNLVDYLWNGHPFWSSNTAGSGAGNFLVMQQDGNLVLYSAANKPLWSTGTGSAAPAPTPTPTPAPTPAPAPTPPASPCSPTNSASGASILTGQVLTEGHALSTGQLSAVMQSDGNFVIYKGTTPLWATNTGQSSDPHNFLLMQSDGNLVIYNNSCQARWASGTNGVNSFAVMQSDGNFVIYSDPSGTPIPKWATNTTTSGVPSTVGVYAYPTPAGNAFTDGWNSIGDTAALGSTSAPYTGLVGGGLDYSSGVAAAQAGKPWLSFWTVSGPLTGACDGNSTSAPVGSNLAGGLLGTNGSLQEGQALTGPNGYQALMQHDGNFVVYHNSTAIWSSNTGRSTDPHYYLVMQVDGNLVIYNQSAQAVWSTGSCISNHSAGAPFLVMQGDGNLVAYYNGSTPIWSSISGLPHVIGTPAQYYSIGYAAGVYAANTISNYGGIRPTYEILDPEGYPDNHSGLDQAGIGSAQWQQIMTGWANGLNTISGMHPAFYATQYEYTNFSLASINLPFFVAVAFGSDGGSGIVPPERLSGVNGSNIVGVTAFYSGVTGAVQCATVVQAANDIANWGYRYNTLQFDGGLRCPA